MQPSILLTDLYQLTMMQGYSDANMHELAVFEFFVRKMPAERNFLLAAGLEFVLGYLENLSFSNEALTYLQSLGIFKNNFLARLRNFKFSGDVNAMPEGTIFFANEPILQVIAPLEQAQLIESRVINLLHLHTLLASKAIRNVLVASDKDLVDFGLRRAHGSEAALSAARSTYMTGFSATSNVLAGQLFKIPVSGTMAHSFVLAHENEKQAFINFAQSFPEKVTLLIDTYDIEKAAKKVVETAAILSKQGISIQAVRIDSGDLKQHAIHVREILDAHGLFDIKIFASGDLDEYKLQQLIAEKAPIDGFGLGTRVDTSNDVPYLDCAYKLQAYAGVPRRKKSEGKVTLPGCKQVFRKFSHQMIEHDMIGLVHESIPDTKALLCPAMRQGKRVLPEQNLNAIRDYIRQQVASLPLPLKQLTTCRDSAISVKISSKLEELIKTLNHSQNLKEDIWP